MKYLSIQFFLASCYFLFLRSKRFPYHYVSHFLSSFKSWSSVL